LVSGKKPLSTLPALPDAKEMQFGIVVSEWNNEITEALFQGAKQTLLDAGVSAENIFRKNVPGSFELPLGAKFFLDEIKPDAVICIGCVIQGETRHFDFICTAVSNGIMQLGLDYSIPVIFGVLTTNTLQQAVDRCGGKFGNKGIEAAVTAIQMAALKKSG
jgi:6,7-dimethyl-8-ribityllumazine synthase